jgi:penicillin-binding protein 2
MSPKTKLEPREDRASPVTPQLALRVAIVGGVAFTLFAIVFFRLWFLQVLSGDQFLATANNNRVRDVRIPAPRGDIVDRNGNVLVDNRVSIAVQIAPEKLPPPGERRNDLYKRLGKVIGMQPKKIRAEIKQQRSVLPYSDVTLKADVSQVVYGYLFERAEQFTEQGVTVQKVFLRRYPKKTLAAQLFGTVGEIGPEQLKQSKFRGVKQGTIVGQGGIEYTYDRYLRGRDGAQRIYIDALGKPKARGPELAPEGGRRLRLSIDSDLQEAGEEGMQQAGVSTSAELGGRRGAFVALDPTNGEVLAMGSYPSFDPNIFAKPVPEGTFKKLNSTEYGAPLYNRAIAGLYPTGSTFKLITGTAALESGVITPSTIVEDGGSITVGGITFKNSGDAVNGPINVSDALKVSSDVFFYTMGLRANSKGGDIIQTWAKKLGLARRTGIDLPGEFKGLVPTPGQVDRAFAKKEFPYNKPWTVGDNINLAVGQGYLQATPLQMAVAYATVANGGKVVRPHVGLRVEDSAGRTLQQIEPDPARRVKIQPSTRDTILEGLRRAAMEPGGTSADVFKGFGREVFGKTGTAERPGQADDQSWYVVYAPAPQPIVLAVTVESGGFGAEAAAPVARYMLGQWFNLKKKFVTGSSKTR